MGKRKNLRWEGDREVEVSPVMGPHDMPWAKGYDHDEDRGPCIHHTEPKSSRRITEYTGPFGGVGSEVRNHCRVCHTVHQLTRRGGDGEGRTQRAWQTTADALRQQIPGGRVDPEGGRHDRGMRKRKPKNIKGGTIAIGAWDYNLDKWPPVRRVVSRTRADAALAAEIGVRAARYVKGVDRIVPIVEDGTVRLVNRPKWKKTFRVRIEKSRNKFATMREIEGRPETREERAARRYQDERTVDGPSPAWVRKVEAAYAVAVAAGYGPETTVAVTDPENPFGWTEHEAEVVRLRESGLSWRKIAERLGTKHPTIIRTYQKARAKVVPPDTVVTGSTEEERQNRILRLVAVYGLDGYAATYAVDRGEDIESLLSWCASDEAHAIVNRGRALAVAA
jgi:hypothetical protein